MKVLVITIGVFLWIFILAPLSLSGVLSDSTSREGDSDKPQGSSEVTH